MSKQARLAPLPFDEKEAFAIARRDVWSRVGTFCYPTHPKVAEDIMDFEVWADLPRLRVDPVSGAPAGAQYFRFKEIGHVRVKLVNGEIESSVSWRTARQSIRDHLEAVETSVEKALLSNAASRFSELAFAEHMHTPIIDMLSGIIVDGRVDPRQWEREPTEPEGGSRFADYVGMLEKADLVRREGDIIRPGNVLIGLQDQGGTPVELLRGSMSHFFQTGVGQIESIRKVIGPHLRLASHVYEYALEWGENESLTPKSLEAYMQDRYPREPRKLIQAARYLLQLARIKILRLTEIGGATVVSPEPDLFDSVSRSSGLLMPFRSALVGRSAAT